MISSHRGQRLLLFLIYINDMPNGLLSDPKLFADATSLFSTVQDITTSTVSLNNDPTKISEWVVQWKMNFHPDPTKQAQEILFIKKKQYSSLIFHNLVHQVQLKKHLRLFLDPKLSFDEQIECILIKTCKIIGMIRKLQPIIPREVLLTSDKSFLRPHLHYGDVIYDRAFNESFQYKLGFVQYYAALANAGAIRGSSREDLYQELGSESLKS